MIFADDTYVLGADAVDLSYSTSGLAQELRSADQFLNSDTCEVLTSEEEAAEEDAPVRLWSDEEVQQYIVSGVHPASSGRDKMHSASSIVALGSHVSYDVAQSAVVSDRVACAGAGGRRFAPTATKRSFLRLRCSLLQSVVAATLLWGLESANAKQGSPASPHWSASEDAVGLHPRPMQRQRGGRRFLPMQRKGDLGHVDTPFSWGQLQGYRYFTFLGHIARQDPAVHLASHILSW